MSSLFAAVGISKQSFYQRCARRVESGKKSAELIPLIKQIRVHHPHMSSRIMYGLIAPIHLGRDLFEAFCFENGFKVGVRRAFHRTTNSLGVTRFNNLLLKKRVTGVNRVWVSDITYYRIGEKFYYLTFILDLYSRFIVGYSISSNLSAENTTIPALRMAMKGRIIKEGLIIHSDGGGQYYCKEWLALTAMARMENSMCESVYENAHAERVNGIIKNDYVFPYGPENFTELAKMTNEAIFRYNYERPHSSLGKMSPDQFEKLPNSNRLPQSPEPKQNIKKKKNALDVDNSKRVTNI